MPLAESAPKTNEISTTPENAKPSGGGKRGPRGPRGAKGGEEHFLYCLDNGKGESGALSLSKPGPKGEILVEAFKTGVAYYRLQKLHAEKMELNDGDVKIVGKPVE